MHYTVPLSVELIGANHNSEKLKYNALKQKCYYQNRDHCLKTGGIHQYKNVPMNVTRISALNYYKK